MQRGYIVSKQVICDVVYVIDKKIDHAIQPNSLSPSKLINLYNIQSNQLRISALVE